MSGSRPNFRIIEGDDDFTGIYDDFVEDYLSPDVSVNDMLKKYGLSHHKYLRLKREVAEEIGVNVKVTRFNTRSKWSYIDNFIDQLKGSSMYWVRRYFGRTLIEYGMYDDLDTARKVRDSLIEHNWDIEYYHQLRHDWFGDEIHKRVSISKIYPDFKEDYMEGHSMKWLMKKYDLSKSHYRQISKKIREEENLARKPQMSYKDIRRYEREIGAV